MLATIGKNFNVKKYTAYITSLSSVIIIFIIVSKQIPIGNNFIEIVGCIED